MKENYENVTLELSQGQTLIFAPKDEGESLYIQQKLFKMGYRWGDDGERNPVSKPGCIAAYSGYIWMEPSAFDFEEGLLCKTQQLEDTRSNSAETPAKGLAREEDMSDLQTYREMMQFPGGLPDQVRQLRKEGRDMMREVRRVDEEALAEALQELDNMIGQNRAKNMIHEVIALTRGTQEEKRMGIVDNEPMSFHMVFTGPPGTGKTTFAEIVAKIFYALGRTDRPEAIKLGRKDIVGEHIGSTDKNIKDFIEEALGGILFIDEAYALSRSDSTRDFGYNAIDALNQAMEDNRDNLIVIVAGYPEEMDDFLKANPGLASRFRIKVSYDNYDMDDLGRILDKMLEKRGRTMTPEARTRAIERLEEDKKEKESNGAAFGNGRIVRNLVEGLKGAHMLHMMNAGQLNSSQGGLSDDNYRKLLTTYTADDVEAVDLSGIGTGEKIATSNARFGFAPAGTPLKRMSLVA